VEETDEHPDGTVLEEIRRGWMMNGRVLRPAAVRVARARSGRASAG
jgi:molecular chaperone GrpE